MTAKSPSDWPGFLAGLRGTTRVTLVGPLYNETFSPSAPTVFVDGGNRYRRAGLENFPCISVGDGDSGQGNLDVRLPAEKDFSDLAFVLRELPPAVADLELLGFWGGRTDHLLANLGELHRFLAKRGPGAKAEMAEGGVIQAVGFKGRLERRISGIFSLMVLERTEVKIEGECRYPLKNPTALEPASSHGLSNEGHGLVTVASNGPCFLFFQT
jgi:thiamine pyrophosphokinase